MGRMFDLDRDAARKQVRLVARVVDKWQAHFAACGVTRGDIELYAEQIDRPFLKQQRAQFLRGRAAS
jgi:serine/threonine-protein kinase HipA